MTTIGKVEEFDPEQEDWPSHEEQLGTLLFCEQNYRSFKEEVSAFVRDGCRITLSEF